VKTTADLLKEFSHFHAFQEITSRAHNPGSVVFVGARGLITSGWDHPTSTTLPANQQSCGITGRDRLSPYGELKIAQYRLLSQRV
jgi:hypothetical protein